MGAGHARLLPWRLVTELSVTTWLVAVPAVACLCGLRFWEIPLLGLVSAAAMFAHSRVTRALATSCNRRSVSES
ncbi:hypothetical protein CBM2598_U10230 [Cupriavidus taiwanensis]|uniref:Uncharacterized protein n=1 Tax=Cupriavidus taiwanensis TaxID=164546 RepID=A0A7Z7JFI5_9BURK|nr:hypothetical protein CBM2597_U10123 [Cupriavidus taiwanensis]SOZ96429.1 hypothetical protein CBM2598_U10230 [Cupriavidus taiwanensis]SPC25629.1 hypothetical protein CBM2594_U10130 [Cupriavidus taiwanensis]